MEKNTSLTSLKIQTNNIGNSGATALANALSRIEKLIEKNRTKFKEDFLQFRQQLTRIQLVQKAGPFENVHLPQEGESLTLPQKAEKKILEHVLGCTAQMFTEFVTRPGSSDSICESPFFTKVREKKLTDKQKIDLLIQHFSGGKYSEMPDWLTSSTV